MQCTGTRNSLRCFKNDVLVYGIHEAYEHRCLGSWLITALKACSCSGELESGRRIHQEALKNGHVGDIYVGNSLVNMYAKCGSMSESHHVFNSLPARDLVSWNSLILGYAVNHQEEVALELFSMLTSLEDGCSPNSRTFVAAVMACSALAGKEEGAIVDGKLVKRRSLEKGVAIHAHASRLGCDSVIFLANSLVDMYAQCGSMNDAHATFKRIEGPTVVSWNALILGYEGNGESEKALELYSRMQAESDQQPNARTYMAALMACSSLATREGAQGDESGKLVKVECLKRGMAIHSRVHETGCEADKFVASALVDMYAKCGRLEMAGSVFEKMVARDVTCWNAMIQGCVDNMESELALEFLARMRSECQLLPDVTTYVSAFTALAHSAGKEPGVVKLFCLQRGMELHREVVNRGLEHDFVLASTVVVMYSKCRSIWDARLVFDRMIHHDIVCWTALILGYVDNEQPEVALELFSYMTVSPSPRTFMAAIMACASLASEEEGVYVEEKLVKQSSLERGMAVHSAARSLGCDSDIFVAGNLIDMFAKCGSMLDARTVFDRMEDYDTVAWTALIQGYGDTGEPKLAFELFRCMERIQGLEMDARTCVAALRSLADLAVAAKEVGDEKGCAYLLEEVMSVHSGAVVRGFDTGDSYVSNTLIDAYCKSGSLFDARMIFDRMAFYDLVSWNTMILGHADVGEGDISLELFRCMSMTTGRNSLTPDDRTFTAVLGACSSLSALEPGKELHGVICRQGLENDPFVATSLVGLYSRCGSMDVAEYVFGSTSWTKNNKSSVVAWTSLVTGYSNLGCSKQVFHLLEEMVRQGLKVDNVTFVAVLAACSHAGEVERGREYFETMANRFGVKADLRHYHCMIDMLGRANMWEKMVRMVESLPCEPNAITWTAVLGACQKWKRRELGKVAFEELVRLDPRGAAAYSLMANIQTN